VEELPGSDDDDDEDNDDDDDDDGEEGGGERISCIGGNRAPFPPFSTPLGGTDTRPSTTTV
jgi:hypothetical protein